MTKLKSAQSEWKGRRKKGIRNLVESSGIRRLSLDQYRSHIRQIYDGPAGAVLAMGSIISLHDPLIGRVLRKRQFDVSESKSILDVGSGAGQILRHLLKATQPRTQLVAFDLSQRMLVRARNRLKSSRPHYLSGDMLRMPFVDGAFDCVTCGWVIEHLPDPVPGLREVGRVLKPGGSAVSPSPPRAVTAAMWSNSRLLTKST